MVSSSSDPRTLTQMLREWDDDALVGLLTARPDLAFPSPTGFSQVASRATTRHSVSEAVATLNAFELWVAQRASTRQNRFAPPDLDVETAVPGDVAAALDRLLGIALLWGDRSALRPVRALSWLLAQTADESAGPPSPSPPRLDGVRRLSPSMVAKVAAGSAFEFVRRIDVLVEHSDHHPTQVRRVGGPAAREVRTLATLLDVPGPIATLHLEIAEAAGLLVLNVRGNDEALTPTRLFDEWQSCSLAEQWSQVARAWLDSHPSSGPRWLKDLCLTAFGDPSAGRVLGLDDMLTWLDWQRPRRGAATNRQTATLLDEAGWIGVTGQGALSEFGRDFDAVRLGALLPNRVDRVVLQADLTAVAPGPVTSQVARDLAAMADVESRGGATVYRFTVESLRRAQSLGWSAAEIDSTLDDISTTPVPQPLRYLVFDLERPPSGPSVVDVPPVPAGQRLADPNVGAQHPRARRPEPRPTPDAGLGPADRLDEPTARRIVANLRQNATEHRGATELRMPTSGEQVFESPLETLREAVETGEVVWFGYVDTAGGSGERLVHAKSVDEGRLEATDVRTEQSLTVPLHRITTAHIIRSDS